MLYHSTTTTTTTTTTNSHYYCTSTVANTTTAINKNRLISQHLKHIYWMWSKFTCLRLEGLLTWKCYLQMLEECETTGEQGNRTEEKEIWFKRQSFLYLIGPAAKGLWPSYPGRWGYKLRAFVLGAKELRVTSGDGGGWASKCAHKSKDLLPIIAVLP
jgi:hypothetical protein